MIYNGENHMVIGNEAYLEPAETDWATVTVSVQTPIVNADRWVGYEKRNAERDLGDSYIAFETDMNVEYLRDDDDDLRQQVRETVKWTDPDAEYDIIY